MTRFRLALPLFLIALCGLMIFPFGLMGQHRHGDSFSDSYLVFQRIEAAVENGTISGDEAILQKLYAGIHVELMDERFKSESIETIKCLTPVLIEFEQSRSGMDPAIVQDIEQLLDPAGSETPGSHLSPSGRFVVRYSVTGQHAVPDEDLDLNGIPDYVERTAFAADSSYSYMVETLGFRDFITDTPYDISFRNFSGTYGITIPSGSTTRIEINNDFEGFPANLHPEGDQTGALYVTVAHELKHSSQYVVNRWQDGTGSRRDWVEMDATLMEHVVFKDVRDYFNYIMSFDREKNDWDRNRPGNRSIFGSPGSATPRAYNHVTWMIYFYERYGAPFWVDVWNEIDQDYQSLAPNQKPIPFQEAMDRVLSRLESTIASEHLINHMWHMSSGPVFANYDFGFLDRINYPVAAKEDPVQLTSDERTFIQNQPPLQSFAARYHDLAPSSVSLGQPSFFLDSDTPGLYLGVVGYFRDGSVQTMVSQDPNSTLQGIQTTWSWPDLVDLNLTVVNTGSTSSGSYTLEIVSAKPEADLITQNYPNPFNPVTRIDFALNESKDVRLEVYDILGRKVSTLVDERLNFGFHSVAFDGSGLASGVYIYRLVTDQAVLSKKMVLVK